MRYLKRLFFCYIMLSIFGIESLLADNDNFQVIAENGLVCDAKKTKCIASGGVKFVGKDLRAYSNNFTIYFDEKQKTLKKIEGMGNIKISLQGQIKATSAKFIYNPSANNIELIGKVNLDLLNSPTKEKINAESLLLEIIKGGYNLGARDVIIKGKRDGAYSYIIKSYKMDYDGIESNVRILSNNKANDRVRGLYLITNDKKTNENNKENKANDKKN